MTTAWIVWLSVTAGTFGAGEWWAMRSGSPPGETLSANIRKWLGVRPSQPRKRWTVYGFTGLIVGFAVWFVPHILG